VSQIYYLDLAAEALPAARVAKAVSDAATSSGSLRSDAVLHADPGGHITLVSGLHVQLFVPEPDPDPDEVAIAFGLDRAVSVWMRQNSSRPADAQYADVVTLTVGVLHQIESDAVLHLEYDRVWLLRRRGTLVLSDDDEWWSPDLLALVNLPYERAPLAFADDG
jgi:hypothetical protein